MKNASWIVALLVGGVLGYVAGQAVANRAAPNVGAMAANAYAPYRWLHFFGVNLSTVAP